MPKFYLFFISLFFIIQAAYAEEQFLDFKTNATGNNVRLYLNDDSSQPLTSLSALSNYVTSKNKRLIFAMNAGMFMANQSPLGLYIENHKPLSKLNKKKGLQGNFYIQPNGVFTIGDKGANIVKTEEWEQYAATNNVRLATQSGPVLVINGLINPAIENAKFSKFIRNGVCLSSKELIFTVSLVEVSLYDLAAHFKRELHCDSALYLDGAISDFVWPEKGYKSRNSSLGPMLVIEE